MGILRSAYATVHYYDTALLRMMARDNTIGIMNNKYPKHLTIHDMYMYIYLPPA